MHQTVKTIFRLCFASVIFLITLSLCFTCFAKIQEILQAEQHYQQATSIPLKSTAGEQYVLVSNNQRPDNAIFRSEERRVGKECRSRWTRDQSIKRVD